MRKVIDSLLSHPLVYTGYQRVVRRGRTIESTIEQELGSAPGEVVDMACGSGLYSNLFNARSYFGFDISPEYVSYARRNNPRHRFGVMDVRQLAFRQGSIDRILAVGLLHHLNDQEVTDTLREASAALAQNGELVVIDLLPSASPFNLLGRFLVSLDRGRFVRSVEQYQRLFAARFSVRKTYAIKTGPYDLGVFVMQPGRQ